MKEFFKMVFATVVGMLIFTIVTVFIGIMCIVGMVSSSSATTSVKDNSVLVLNLSGVLNERAESNLIGELIGNSGNTIGLDEVIDAIRKAKENDKIKGIYIEAGMFSASYASLQEIRDRLADFRKAGKWIVAYGDIYTQGTYYVSSVANKVFLNPQGQIDWRGLSAQPFYVKDLLAKFGVKMQVAKVGAYKRATEMFTGDKMSDANREQVTVYLNGVWDNICKAVAGSRGISTDSLNAYADRLLTLEASENYKKYKMVDGLIYTNQVKDEVKKLLKLDKDDDINRLGIADMANVKETRSEGEEIAIYYAYGNIVDDVAGGMMGDEHVIDAQEVCKDLEQLMDNDDVKAVVIRVNSGGGSAYASEQIWNQVKELKAKKPVVVSMGDYAASGGYYISCIANWIVAEPTTLTGSIGIFGMFPDANELLTQKLGVKFDEVKTNRNSGFGTIVRPFNDEEMHYLTAYINRGYNLFRSRVADGRKMSVDAVEKIAQGHVWLGQDALKIKLVDQLGGLEDAIRKAAQLAKIEQYHTNSYPAKKSFLDQLLSGSAKGDYLGEYLGQTFSDYVRPLMFLRTFNQQNAIQARMPFVLNVR